MKKNKKRWKSYGIAANKMMKHSRVDFVRVGDSIGECRAIRYCTRAPQTRCGRAQYASRTIYIRRCTYMRAIQSVVSHSAR